MLITAGYVAFNFKILGNRSPIYYIQVKRYVAYYRNFAYMVAVTMFINIQIKLNERAKRQSTK
ncbi:hypothetical protein AHMF7616_03425 [Adhaeribacter pallidiroseus]|uniref:Uncharacterized protein n=1 Tax=Adhaeribacter pallidiroseus TaxID=2072847 RepID=A0A369QMB6_9BACT|nr:hypothetical protein AHMF7616_03425 [Adhaeribacter pallidiroseus]